METVCKEALFGWILLLSTGCFLDYPREVFGMYERTKKGYPISAKFRNYNPDIMTCNCSWGSVIYKTGGSTSRGNNKRQKARSDYGGRDVEAKENYPMLAGIHSQRTECTVCGATILSEYHALTTAYCVQRNLDLLLSVGVKNRCRRSNDGGEYIPLLKTTYIHEDYNSTSQENDLAVVLTARKIIFSNSVGPACIHTEQICDEKGAILILGWGKLKSSETASPSLLKIFVEAVEPVACKKELNQQLTNPHLWLCTSAYKIGRCPADSGSPLFMVDQSIKRIVLVGVMTSESFCGRTDVPAIHVSIHPFLGWIQWTVEKSLKNHYPRDFKRCDSSFCYITNPNVT
nr:trypsin, alkaline C-like [Halyomorpha halys]